MAQKPTILLLAAGIFAGTILTGCEPQSRLVSDPKVLLQYSNDPSQKNLQDLSKAYSSLINHNRREGISQPGLFSDYAVTLALLGRRAEANGWFNNEAATFPSSAPAVNELKKKLIPEFADDTKVSSETVTFDDEPLADSAAVSSPATTVEPSATTTAPHKMTPKEKKKAQKMKAREKKKAQKAKAKAKKQAQKAKAKAKKEAQKAKSKAK